MIDIEYLQYSLSLARRSSKYASYFFSEGSKLLLHFARRAIEDPRNGPRSPPCRDWMGRNKRGSRQGIVPHLRDRPFVGIGQSLGIFQASRPSFCPSFFLLGPLASLLLAPSPLPHTGPLFSICSTLRSIGALASRRPTPVPFSFPAFIFIIIIIIRVSIFVSGRFVVFYSSHCYYRH